MKWFDLIRKAKKPSSPHRLSLGTLSSKRIPAAFESYSSIDWASGLSALPPPLKLTKKERRALEHCYGSETAALRDLRAHVRELQPERVRSKCAYCGVRDEDQLDHYLSQEAYPEFNVLSLNLIPSCGRCNRRRSKNLGTLVTDRDLVHVYFDALPQTPIIFADVRATANGGKAQIEADFHIDTTQAVPQPAADHLRRHIEFLKLLSEFARQAPNQLVRIYESARNCLWSDQNTFKQFLLKEARSLEVHWGPNGFGVVLHRGAAASQTFIALCCT